MTGSKKKAAPTKVVKEVKNAREAKPKKIKDENAPKRPLSAYLFFCSAHRDATKKKYPDEKIMKKLGELWKALADKSEYEELAKQAKTEYDVAVAEYKSSGGGAEASAKSNKRKQPEKKSATAKNSKKAKVVEAKPETSEEDEEEEDESSADEQQKASNLSEESGDGSGDDSEQADE